MDTKFRTSMNFKIFHWSLSYMRFHVNYLILSRTEKIKPNRIRGNRNSDCYKLNNTVFYMIISLNLKYFYEPLSCNYVVFTQMLYPSLPLLWG